MSKFLGGIIFLLFFILAKTASADLINPDYYRKKCPEGAREIVCSYKSTKPFGPNTYDECARYENNPNYQFLAGEGHSFGGTQKYCFKAVSASSSAISNLGVLLQLVLITLLLEVPVFIAFGFGGRKAFLAFLYVNLISVPLLYLTTISVPYTGFGMLVLMEAAVALFEAILLKFMLKTADFKKITIYSICANVVSSVFGGLLLRLIGGILKI